MSTLLAPADVREHVDTDLLDPALQRLLDAADGEILKRYGVHSGTVTEIIDGGEGLVFLSRPVLSITTITERTGLTDTILAANDWRTWYDNRAIERLNSGTNGAELWAERVTVAYVAKDESAIRKAVELELVKAAIHYEAIQAQTVGDYAETSLPYVQERDAILGQLSPAMGVA